MTATRIGFADIDHLAEQLATDTGHDWSVLSIDTRDVYRDLARRRLSTDSSPRRVLIEDHL